jgi:hypothetical protein
LLLFYLLLQLLDGGAIRCGSVGLEDLDIFVCEWRNLLLLDLVVGKVLLVLLPVLSRGRRLVLLASYAALTDSTEPTMLTVEGDQSPNKGVYRRTKSAIDSSVINVAGCLVRHVLTSFGAAWSDVLGW